MTATRVRGEPGPACAKCDGVKVWSGTRWLCRPCHAKANRERKASLSPERAERETRRANDRRNERNALWTPEKRAAVNAATRLWRQNNRERHREKSRASYRRRAEEIKARKAG